MPARELKLFLTQRGLMLPSTGRIAPSVLKAKLEDADDNVTFAGFSDLPPEVRLCIYELYFSSLEQPLLDTNCQPPITLASRMTRQEALPLFYAGRRFTFRVDNRAYIFRASPFSEARPFHPNTEAFIQNTAAQNFARMRILRIFLANEYDAITIHFDDEANPIRGDKEEEYRRELEKRMIPMLQTWAKDIAARRGPMKLRKEDVLSLRSEVLDALRQHYA